MSNTRKSKRGNYKIEDLGDVELPAELIEKIEKATQLADAELEAVRVNFRWQREPLDLVKSVANAMGIPYQTYIKMVLVRQAVEDYRKMSQAASLEKQTPSIFKTSSMQNSDVAQACSFWSSWSDRAAQHVGAEPGWTKATLDYIEHQENYLNAAGLHFTALTPKKVSNP